MVEAMEPVWGKRTVKMVHVLLRYRTRDHLISAIPHFGERKQANYRRYRTAFLVRALRALGRLVVEQKIPRLKVWAYVNVTLEQMWYDSNAAREDEAHERKLAAAAGSVAGRSDRSRSWSERLRVGFVLDTPSSCASGLRHIKGYIEGAIPAVVGDRASNMGDDDESPPF
ncbi:MAG: hypothetical protein ACYTG0_35425 [Planctomycetota bacterium]|jgi:hypothetical protein